MHPCFAPEFYFCPCRCVGSRRNQCHSCFDRVDCTGSLMSKCHRCFDYVAMFVKLYLAWETTL